MPLLALVGLAAGPSGALAQQDLASAARECATISADALRLACYDAAFRSARGGGASVAGGQPAAADAGAAAKPSAQTAQPAPEHGAPTQAELGAAAARPGAASSVPEREISPPHALETRASSAAPPASAAGSGDFDVTIVEVRRLGQRTDVRLVTEDGRVWRQTDGRRVRLPNPPFRAVITHGALGSHFLSPVGENVSLRVTEEHP